MPAELDGLDGLVMPGGESTTMTLGVQREGLADPLREFAGPGEPVLGTCAGMIMLDRDHLGAGHVCERNAFGRQTHSFEADLDIPGIDGRPCARSSSAPRGWPSTAKASRPWPRSTATLSPPARTTCS